MCSSDLFFVLVQLFHGDSQAPGGPLRVGADRLELRRGRGGAEGADFRPHLPLHQDGVLFTSSSLRDKNAPLLKFDLLSLRIIFSNCASSKNLYAEEFERGLVTSRYFDFVFLSSINAPSKHSVGRSIEAILRRFICVYSFWFSMRFIVLKYLITLSLLPNIEKLVGASIDV